MQTEGRPLTCQFASVSNAGAIEREDIAALSDLGDAVRRAQRVVLVLAASDVTLLRVKVPPMPAAKLKAALPNLVEDQLMSDPAECVVVAGGTVDDLRGVAVVQRSWLELLAKTLLSLGARHISAVPAQLCLPLAPEKVSAAIVEYGREVEVAARLAEQEGLGLPVYADQPATAPGEALQALSAVVPQSAMTLYVPTPHVAAYKDALRLMPALEERVTVVADTWPRWVAGANGAAVDLMQGLGAAAGPAFDWRPWRWPIALAAAVVAVNAFGLNIDWLRMKHEADALHANMIQTYRNAFPKDTVIIDPLAQMRQKAAAAQRNSGQIAQDDFLALTAAFGEVWAAAGQKPQNIASLEYHDRVLSVKIKPEASVPLDQMKTAMSQHNLTLTQASTGVWQIRSGQ
jgi:general secretion pathway protein L